MKDFPAGGQDAGGLSPEEAAAQDYDERDAWWTCARAALSVKLKYLGGDARWAGSRVLQLQCESGILADGLLRRGCAVTAVDTREAMLRHARERSQAHGYRVTYRHAAALSELPFESGAFDIVLCDHVFDRELDRRAVLAEAARVLCPEGVLMVACTRPGLLPALRMRFFPGRMAAGLPKHLGRRRGIEPKALQALMAEAGFVPLRTGGFGPKGIPGVAPQNYGVSKRLRPIWLGTARRR
ncbi:class I SAM-dependent methyltransferase [Poseidonocella sp. HB161398]|uniref:class I SAM-dependent methyltransferase n=1 Tax=Poseidonocella sp. HB161398 TaxID=2320855 RepID=UPI001485C80D|nr:class I SAM-dependent methyltransferase [Poseidonocella sp. HB161398]